MKKGFAAYWKRVFMRSGHDTKAFLGSNPFKATHGFVVVLLGAIVSSVIVGHDVWEKVAWSVLSLLIGIAIFLSCWLIFLVRTPWQFEVEKETETDKLIVKITELELVILEGREATQSKIVQDHVARMQTLQDCLNEVKRLQVMTHQAHVETIAAEMKSDFEILLGKVKDFIKLIAIRWKYLQ
jgi:hypothetical protein